MFQTWNSKLRYGFSMAFYVLLMCVLCCLFQYVFLFFSPRVSGNNTQVFYCVRKEWCTPLFISWYCFHWKYTIFIIVFELIVCVPTNIEHSVILIFLFHDKFALHLILWSPLRSFSRDIFVAVRSLSTSYRVDLAISVLGSIRRPCFEFPADKNNNIAIT